MSTPTLDLIYIDIYLPCIYIWFMRAVTLAFSFLVFWSACKFQNVFFQISNDFGIAVTCHWNASLLSMSYNFILCLQTQGNCLFERKERHLGSFKFAVSNDPIPFLNLATLSTSPLETASSKNWSQKSCCVVIVCCWSAVCVSLCQRSPYLTSALCLTAISLWKKKSLPD